MNTQEKLSALYQQRFTDAKRIEQVCSTHKGAEDLIRKISAPFLVKYNDEYESSAPRVVIVGQETNGWFENHDFKYKHFLDNKTVDDALSFYDRSNFGEKYPSTFFKYFHKLRGMIFPTKSGRRAILWLNLLKFDCRPHKMYLCPQFLSPVLELQGDILNREIQLLKSRVVIFLTGPYYDPIIRRFFPDAEFVSMQGFPERKAAEVKGLSVNGTPVLSFRTYHPNYLNRIKAKSEQILAAIRQRIVNAFRT